MESWAHPVGPPWTLDWEFASVKSKTSVFGALALAVMATWAWGCDDEPARVVWIENAEAELAAAFCEPMFDCECAGGRRFPDEQQCRQEVADRVDRLRADGEERGLTYDPTCLGTVLDRMDERGCGPAMPPSSDCDLPCWAYHGTAQEGDPCEWRGAWSTCAQGLSCDNLVCRNPCQRAGEGQPCNDTPCAEGMVCNVFDADGICELLPNAGEPCPYGECGSGAFCDQPDPMDPSITVCVALVADGEPCSGHRQCETGHCPVGRCAPMPLRDQPCPAGACGAGLQCVEGVCTDGEPAACYDYLHI